MSIHQFSLRFTIHTFMHPYKVEACFRINIVDLRE